MKLHFESDLTYQQNAITSVCDLFEGQEKWESEMTVLAPAQGHSHLKAQQVQCLLTQKYPKMMYCLKI